MTKSERQLLAQFFLNAKRCGAKTKRNNNAPCKGPAMANGRCRLHGGKSTGPRTAAGKRRSAKANYKHGFYTKQAIEDRRKSRTLLSDWEEDLKLLEDNNNESIPTVINNTTHP